MDFTEFWVRNCIDGLYKSINITALSTIRYQQKNTEMFEKKKRFIFMLIQSLVPPRCENAKGI